jgi:hypothetical protein
MGCKLVILGDVSEWIGQSRAFRDYVYESNKGRVLWFVADEGMLNEKIGGD